MEEIVEALEEDEDEDKPLKDPFTGVESDPGSAHGEDALMEEPTTDTRARIEETKATRSLNVAMWNVRGMNAIKKKLHLQRLMVEVKTDIAMLNETRLT